MLGGGGPSSSASSSAGTTCSRAPSNFSEKSFGKSSMSSTMRKVLLTEVPDDADGDEAELIPDESTHETAVIELPALEEFLQDQAGCFAAELRKAEEWSVDGETLESLEQNFEQCAEALVTMKEARSRSQGIRKDRGYGKAGGFKSNGGKVGQASVRKRLAITRASTATCTVIGQVAKCTMPGAGLGKADGMPRPKAKRVRLA